TTFVQQSASEQFFSLFTNIASSIPSSYGVKLILGEVLILDFVPTSYQLSLFQNYFASSNRPFNQISSPYSGVWALKTLQGFGDLHFENVDGLQSIDTDVKLSLPTPLVLKYIVVKVIRCNALSDAPNICITLDSLAILRIFRFNDTLYQSSYNYSEYQITNDPYGNKITNIDAYVDSNNNIFIFASNYVEPFTYYSQVLYKYQLIPGDSVSTQDSISFINNFNIVPLDVPSSFGNEYTIGSFKCYLYPNDKVYLFMVYQGCSVDYSGLSTLYQNFYIYDVSDFGTITLVYNNFVVNGLASWTFNDSIVKYPDGKIYYIYRVAVAGSQSIVWDVSDPLSPIKLPNVSSWSHFTNVSAPQIYFNQPYSWCPSSVVVNPVTNKVFSMQNFIKSSDGGLTTQTYIAYKDFTNLAAIPGSNLIVPIFNNVNGNNYNLKDNTYNTFFKTTVWNQKVWVLVDFYDTGLRTNLGSVFIDISNPEYTFANFESDVSKSSLTSSYTNTNIQGIGTSIIGQIDNLGNQGWLSYFGGDGTDKWAINCNTSNIELEPTLREIYVAGSFQDKVEARLSDNTIMNRITTSLIDS
ncbi:MAG: hypothetical protein EB127_23420, partial [Alphaproteobacteria bacterium]|nr:hypothetical protein [Alphaproteobacteria bacterium]